MHDVLICDSKFLLFLSHLILDDEVVEKYLVYTVERFLQYYLQSFTSRLIVAFQQQLIPMVLLQQLPELFESITT